jgi:hypothetical protein
MPAWNKALSDQDIWKGTAFLARANATSGCAALLEQSFGIVPQLPVRRRARTSGDRRPISSLRIYAHSKGIAHSSAAKGG